MEALRTLKARLPGPPSVQASFERQSAWKSWTILLLLALLGLSLLATIRAGRREPDIVVVNSQDGRSTYVERSVATESLLRYLAQQKQRPTDLTVATFSRDQLEDCLDINSTTIDVAWPRCLSRMTKELHAKVKGESDAQKLVATYRAAQVRTDMTIEDLALVDSSEDLFRVRATVRRDKVSLVGGPTPPADRLEVELDLLVVPRDRAHPDGLMVRAWRMKELLVASPTTSAAEAQRNAP